MRQLLLRPRDRAVDALRDPQTADDLREMLAGIHCFEITAAVPLCDELTKMGQVQGAETVSDLLRTGLFLPAPKTWIEHLHKGARVAYLAEEHPGTPWIQVTMFSENLPPVTLGALTAGNGVAAPGTRVRPGPRFLKIQLPPEATAPMLGNLSVFLVVINSPRIVGRRCHEPHKGLARAIKQHRDFRRAFTLLPWHEIKLQIAKPADVDDDTPHRDQITGQRALHFVRKFLRIRLGRLEYVSAHWRGNPAFGIHRATYRVGG
jgi:hypothetical protein